MNIALGRRCLLAEAVGTALLVVFGAGAVVAALATGKGELDYAGLGIIALSFALVIASVIYMFGTTSGAHINPAVTVSLAVVRRFPWAEVVPYIAAQLLGASPARYLSTRSSVRRRATCAGPLAGAVIAALAYVAIAQPGRAPDTVRDAQGTEGSIEGHRVLPEHRAGTDPDQQTTTTGETHGR